MKLLVTFTYSNYPEGEASSIRLDSIMRMYMANGYRIKIVSMSRTEPDVWKEYNGIEYMSIRSTQTNIVARTKNVLLYKKRIEKILKSLGKIDAIFITAIPHSAILVCKRFAQENNCELYIDRTEWYSSCEFRLGRLDHQYRENDKLNRVLIDKQFKVVSISHYFEEYYKSKGIATVRIPAVMDTQAFPVKELHSKEGKVTLLYAGSPAKKDSLLMMLNSLNLLDDETMSRLDFRVVGVTEDWARKQMKSLPKCVTFYGRVPRAEVLKHLQEADFATLFRDPNERFTKAGFPSKVAESMSSGTPMITNITSDLDEYLQDGVNSIVVENYTEESFATAIERAVNLDKRTISDMKEKAKFTATSHFDYRCYIDRIAELIGLGGTNNV